MANAIIDGTDAIMLRRAAAGKPWIEAVGPMVRTRPISSISCTKHHILQQEAVRNATVRTVANAVSYSCCQMARDLNANAIITPEQLRRRRMVARFRPGLPDHRPDPRAEHAYNQLGLSYGVVPAQWA